MKLKLNNDQGVAGLTILLSVVVMLFVIGLLVMIFALMGGELRDATYTTTAATVTNETATGLMNTTGTSALAGASANQFAAFTVTVVHNESDGVPVLVGNYTANTDSTLTNATATAWPYAVNVSYTYTYGADNDATNVMNDTTAAVSDVTDWFSIFLVITAMVVLILLTVIIITAIKGSGMLQGGA